MLSEFMVRACGERGTVFVLLTIVHAIAEFEQEQGQLRPEIRVAPALHQVRHADMTVLARTRYDLNLLSDTVFVLLC